jgi:hypothetical protein
MFSRRVLIAAALLYATVMGCVMSSPDDMAESSSVASSSPSATAPDLPVTGLVPLTGLKPYCAVAMQLQRVDWVEEYKRTIDDIAAEGADTVSLVVDARQEDGESTRMYVDMRITMTVAQLSDIIQHAKLDHLRVILMPIVLLDAPRDDTEWRGTLKPRDWHSWFENYRDMIEHYARIANTNGVDVLVVGSELVSSEKHVDEWINTIKEVRNIYKGQLTYSSNWDRYEQVPFWKYLDFVGMNSYWTLGKDRDVTVPEICKEWQSIQSKIFPFLEKVHKPMILLEAGWCSLANAAKDPWDYTQDTLDEDDDLQTKLYEGFFQSWWGKPQLAGFALWEMHPGGDLTGKGYTPQGKPAEQVMREWFAKSRWNIMQHTQ